MTVPTPLTLALVFVVPVATLVAFVGWVYRNAALRGSDQPFAWALATAAGGIVGLVYLGVRHRIGPRTAPRTRGERVALATWLTGFLSVVAVSVVAPPDPFTQGRYATGAFVVALPVVYAVVARFERR